MGKHIIEDGYVTIGGVDLSDYVRTVEVNVSRADVEKTGLGADGTERLAGKRNDSFVLTLAQDFAAGAVHDTLWDLFLGSTAFEVKVSQHGSTFSATNPVFTGQVILTEYPIIAGAPGDLAESPITMPVSGTISMGTA